MKCAIRVLAASFIAGLVTAGYAQAQGYPAKPIRFIVGFPPGGTNDIVARALAPKLSGYLGQSVVVDNRGGANTAIASELFVRMPPDGYTIMLNAPGHATNPALIKLNFDSVISEIDGRDRHNLTGLNRLSIFLQELFEFLLVDRSLVRQFESVCPKRHWNSRRSLFGDNRTEYLEAGVA